MCRKNNVKGYMRCMDVNRYFDDSSRLQKIVQKECLHNVIALNVLKSMGQGNNNYLFSICKNDINNHNHTLSIMEGKNSLTVVLILTAFLHQNKIVFQAITNFFQEVFIKQIATGMKQKLFVNFEKSFRELHAIRLGHSMKNFQ